MSFKSYIRPFVRPLIRLARLVAGQDLLVRTDVTLAYSHHGSDYGGWDIITDGFNDETIVYSCGVGDDISFDLSIIEATGASIHAFDPTPRSIAWVEQADTPSNFRMHAYGVAGSDGTVAFSPPENPAHISHTILDRAATSASAIEVPVKRISTIMTELGHDKIDVLKMDIEGAEYEVVEDLIRSRIVPDQILVEFHHRFPGVGAAKTRRAIAQLRSAGYLLYAVSPTREDFSMIHRDVMGSG